MKNKLATCFGYIFIVIFSFGILYFQAGTLSMIPKETLSQNYTGDGFVNEEGNTYNPMPNTPSNEEIYALVNKYLPIVGIGNQIGKSLLEEETSFLYCYPTYSIRK